MKEFFLWYLRFLAKMQLKKINPLIIAIGGSSGKSSVSFLIKTVLQGKYKIRSTKGKNSQTGIPLTILDINITGYSVLNWIWVFFQSFLTLIFDWRSYDILIAEMGIDGPYEPNNMSYLLKIIKPKIAVLTNIAIEHSQYFDSLVTDRKTGQRQDKLLDEIKKEESLLVSLLTKSDTAVVNLDDENIREIKTSAEKITISIKDKKADFYIYNYEVSLSSCSFFFINGNKKYVISISRPLPSHYGYSMLMAVAVARRAGVSVDESIKLLENNFSLPAGRVGVFEGIKQTTLIDSSYNNATLTPIIDLLSMLKKIAGKRRKVVIIGDMRELGSMSQQIHQDVARQICNTCNFAVLIGPMMKQYVLPIFLNQKFPCVSFGNVSEALPGLEDLIKNEDIILIKGSQNTLFLERVVEILLKNSKDKEKLCRRGRFWDDKRAKTP